MKSALKVTFVMFAFSSEAEFVLHFANGCDEPDWPENGRKFFVDPARGSKKNDGSEAKPWHTLAEVLDPANHLVATRAYARTSAGLGPPRTDQSGGPIKPGDTIVLMSGDHGAVEIRQYVNQDVHLCGCRGGAGPPRTFLARRILVTLAVPRNQVPGPEAGKGPLWAYGWNRDE